MEVAWPQAHQEENVLLIQISMSHTVSLDVYKTRELKAGPKTVPAPAALDRSSDNPHYSTQTHAEIDITFQPSVSDIHLMTAIGNVLEALLTENLLAITIDLAVSI